MKTRLSLLLFFLILMSSVSGSILNLVTVKQPTCLPGNQVDTAIHLIDVPFVTLHADPEWRFTAISQLFVPPTDDSWNHSYDVNLASVYGLQVEGTGKGSGRDTEVVIDARKGKVPQGCPFSPEQVIGAVDTCVRLM